jgi:hypothetical protein
MKEKFMTQVIDLIESNMLGLYGPNSKKNDHDNLNCFSLKKEQIMQLNSRPIKYKRKILGKKKEPSLIQLMLA